MLTASKQSEKGYWIEEIRKNIYSLEEINYFLYHHIDLLYRDFFCDALFDFLDLELEEHELAEKLRKMSRSAAGTSQMVRCLLSESYYYNSRELSELTGLVAELDSFDQADRLKIQGEKAFKEGRYEAALESFLQILIRKGRDDHSDAFYAQIAYMAGKIYAYMLMVKMANSYFNYAYELYPDPMYARACMYMSMITGDDEEKLQSIVRYKMSDETLESIEDRVASIKHEISAGADTIAFKNSINTLADTDMILNKWKEEYYITQK